MVDIEKNVQHPIHYGGKENPYEVIRVLKAWGLDNDAYLWNVAKYIARAGKKDGNSMIQDLEKARWYLDYKIQLLDDSKPIDTETVRKSASTATRMADVVTTTSNIETAVIPNATPVSVGAIQF